MGKHIPSNYWAKPKFERHQLLLFGPSVDDAVPQDHAVRELEAILRKLDWGPFEQSYDGHRGQPAVHPRLMAGALLYGLMCGLRTSRQVEDATRMRIDFLWLLQGTSLDHTTLAKFRKKFKDELRDLFGQVNRMAVERMSSKLQELVVDGTRVRANSDRHGARTAGWLERRLAEAQQQLVEAMAQMEAADEKEAADEVLAADGRQTAGPTDAEDVQRRIDELKAEMAKLDQALAVARERDLAKKAKDGRNAVGVRVPVTDPEASLMPNKEGGYAPNYTPVVAVDAGTGLVVAAEVLPDGSEAASVQPLVESVQQEHGGGPTRVLFDSGFASGANQEQLAAKGIEVYAPSNSPTGEAHPAYRQDPSRPLPPERIAGLPRVKSSGKLDRNAFLYDPQNDLYWCPMGRAMPPARVLSRQTLGGPVHYIEYQCVDCEHCPLSAQCLSRRARRRRIQRDQYEGVREDTARRMATEGGKAIYRRRAPVVEGTFGVVKSAMGVRRFLLRGLDNVRTEWLWVCTAFNLKKLLSLLRAKRSQGAGGPGSGGTRRSGLIRDLAAAVQAWGALLTNPHLLRGETRTAADPVSAPLNGAA